MRTLTFLIIAILLLPAISAIEVSKADGDGFNIFYSSLNDKISLDQESSFKVQIENTRDTIERFRLKSFASDWTIRTHPTYVQFSGQSLYPREVKEFTLYLKPDEDIRFGQHELSLQGNLENYSPTKFSVSTYVEPTRSNKKKYATDVDIVTQIPATLDPRESFVMRFTLNNLNKNKYSEIDFYIKSPLLNEKITTSLDALEKNKIVELKKVFDPKLTPQIEEIIVTVNTDNELYKTIRRTVSVIDYTETFTEHLEEKGNLLKTTKTIKYTNDGNAAKTQQTRVRTNLIETMFSKTNPEANVIKDTDGKRYFQWDLTLNPEESSYNFVVITSYRSLALILLILFGVILYYYTNKSPIVITKHSIAIEKTEEGIKEVKVTLNIRNTSNLTFDNITVTDKVPSIATIVADTRVGPMKPTKILKSKKHRDLLLIWDLDCLEPGEDKLLSYRIKPKLSIIGDFDLKPAFIKYPSGDKAVRVESNKSTVLE
jgi:hypothetical protein